MALRNPNRTQQPFVGVENVSTSDQFGGGSQGGNFATAKSGRAGSTSHNAASTRHHQQNASYGGGNSQFSMINSPPPQRTINYGTISSTGEQFSIKSHLQGLENTLGDIITEIKYHRQQVGILKSEKETLESVLTMKIDDVRKTVRNEESRVKDEMNRYGGNQNAEGNRLNLQVRQLNTESNTMSQKLLSLQRRIQELESHVGITEDK